LKGFSGVTLLAAAGENVALLRAEETRIVDVREVPTGRLISRFEANGRVKSIALSAAYGAVATYRPSIELFDSETGQRLASVAAAAERVAISGTHVVFAIGRTIKHLDVRTQRVSQLAIASSRPIGLSIEGTRVAWAENLPPRTSRNRARIRAISLTP
jgi:hypothetical protein